MVNPFGFVSMILAVISTVACILFESHAPAFAQSLVHFCECEEKLNTPVVCAVGIGADYWVAGMFGNWWQLADPGLEQ